MDVDPWGEESSPTEINGPLTPALPVWLRSAETLANSIGIATKGNCKYNIHIYIYAIIAMLRKEDY